MLTEHGHGVPSFCFGWQCGLFPPWCICYDVESAGVIQVQCSDVLMCCRLTGAGLLSSGPPCLRRRINLISLPVYQPCTFVIFLSHRPYIVKCVLLIMNHCVSVICLFRCDHFPLSCLLLLFLCIPVHTQNVHERDLDWNNEEDVLQRQSSDSILKNPSHAITSTVSKISGVSSSVGTSLREQLLGRCDSV